MYDHLRLESNQKHQFIGVYGPRTSWTVNTNFKGQKCVLITPKALDIKPHLILANLGTFKHQEHPLKGVYGQEILLGRKHQVRAPKCA